MKMRKVMVVALLAVLAVALASCDGSENKRNEGQSDESQRSEIQPKEGCEAFWGDSTLVLRYSKPQNGYEVSAFSNRNLYFVHFKRGNTISRYCAIDALPRQLSSYADTVGVFTVDVDIPVFRADTLGGSQKVPDMFFMDVNFDGQDEFVVEYDGYNRKYYACFNLVHGSNSSCPGLLEAMHEAPFNNIVATPRFDGYQAYDQCRTVFNRKDKEIYIYEDTGCCSHHETWAKLVEDEYGFKQIKVTKEVTHDYSGRTHTIETRKLVNDTLKLVSTQKIPF